MKLLFITWDSPNVSYLESLFLPIFHELKEYGGEFYILQFTWGDQESIERKKELCNGFGFEYHAVKICRTPVAIGSLVTSIVGALVIKKIIKKYDIDVVMPRSTLPALSTLVAIRNNKIPIIFDADGLPLDERVDFANQLPSSFTYRLMRDIEAQAVRRADIVLTRSRKAIDILVSRAGAGVDADKFHVVTNGRDPELFYPSTQENRDLIREKLKIPSKAKLLVYAGSVGAQYCFPEMVKLFKAIEKEFNNTYFLILTGSPDQASAFIKNENKNISKKSIIISVAPCQIPKYLACADIGLALRQPSFSMQAVAPIKLAEYLLCGLPVIATRDIGDTSAISQDVGFLLDGHTDDDLDAALLWVIDVLLGRIDNAQKKARVLGVEHFSVSCSVLGYRAAFEALSKCGDIA